MAILHWKIQRISAILIIPIIIYLVIYLLNIGSLTYQELRNDIASPLGTFTIIISSLIVYIHSALGIAVVFEDYVHNLNIQKIIILISNLFHIFLFISTFFLLLIIKGSLL